MELSGLGESWWEEGFGGGCGGEELGCLGVWNPVIMGLGNQIGYAVCELSATGFAEIGIRR